MKQKSLKQYVQAFRSRCISQHGEAFAQDNEELIETAARNKRLLDRFDTEIDDADLSMTITKSNGAIGAEINPLIKHRNDIAKLYADNLDALQLTARSRYKKQEGRRTDKTDPMQEYLNQLRIKN